MDDKKNIVIKVKCSDSNKNKPDIPAPKVITQWNIRRIVTVFVGLVFFILVLSYLFWPKPEDKAVQSKAVLSTNETTQVVDKVIPDVTVQSKLVRSLFTTKVINNEPIDHLELPLKFDKTKPTPVFYFAELNAVKDKTIYHEWLLDGVLITRKKVHISDDTWRTSSRQLFSDSKKTNWTVRLVDEAGNVLNELAFNVVYE
jgi:hypothetical protein